MRYYVVADPHAYFTLMSEALEKAGFFADESEKKLVLCGDALDRGTEIDETVDFLVDLKNKGQLIFITGNHEDLLVCALNDIVVTDVSSVAYSYHSYNGTWDTLLGLAHMSESQGLTCPDELVRRVRKSSFYTEILSAGVDYFETENYIFCHGWIPICNDENGYSYNTDWREASFADWRKARWYNGMDMACKHSIIDKNKTVVCGHWHTSYGHAHFGGKKKKAPDFSPFYATGIIAIDAATANSGKVNCIVIDDEELKG